MTWPLGVRPAAGHTRSSLGWLVTPTAYFYLTSPGGGLSLACFDSAHFVTRMEDLVMAAREDPQANRTSVQTKEHLCMALPGGLSPERPLSFSRAF